MEKGKLKTRLRYCMEQDKSYNPDSILFLIEPEFENRELDFAKKFLNWTYIEKKNFRTKDFNQRFEEFWEFSK